MIGCILQARMSSIRLPGKVMMKIDNENTMLDCVINQLKNSKQTKNLVIATTEQKEDDVIVELVKRREIKYFRGSKKDVLDRYYQTAKEYKATTVVRLTSDCPLIDPYLIDDTINLFIQKKVDYVVKPMI